VPVPAKCGKAKRNLQRERRLVKTTWGAGDDVHLRVGLGIERELKEVCEVALPSLASKSGKSSEGPKSQSEGVTLTCE